MTTTQQKQPLKTPDVTMQLRIALQQIAATPLWGEVIADEALRQDYRDCGEYDDDGFAPSCDTESTMLRDAIELARTILANLPAQE